jgi:protein involved in polysaccharide export with SLBB domain
MHVKRTITILTVLICFCLPAAAVSDAEIQQAKEFIQSPEGREMLKSPEGQKAIEDIQAEAAAKPKEGETAPPTVAASVQEEVSVVESAFGKPVKQYGYDIFKTTLATFTPAGDVPIGPDYIIGPGDTFNITLWGVAEGVFKTTVDREGNIILPKVGVVHVTGLAFGDLKPVIEQELSKYYEKINVGVSIADLRTIRVFVVGEVARPGSYSVSSLSTIFNALFTAGGPTKKGTLRNIALIRGDRNIARVDLYKFLLSGDKSQDHQLQSGDTVFVPVIGPTAGISGNVYRPAIYEIKDNSDLIDVINLAGGVLPTGNLNRVQIERVISHEKRVILDKQISLSSKNSKLGIPLKNMDFVNVYNIYSAIGNMVVLEGSVKNPGPYELKAGSRVKDIIPSVSALTFSAYLPKAEIVRIDKGTLQSKIIPVNLERLFSGDGSQDLELESGDRIVVATELKDEEKVEIIGQVKLPSTYTVQPGERLSSVLARAGGYTKDAYLFGSVFTRVSAKGAQQSSLKKLFSNLQISILRKEREISALSSEELAAKKAELENTKELVSRLQNEAVEGRVVIELDDPARLKGSKYDIELENGDRIVVPKIPKIVNVVGEVYSSSSLLYDPDMKASDYVNRLGGFTKYADQGQVYVLKANGSILSRERGYDVLSAKLSPGDTIIVPEQIEHFDFFAAVRDSTKWFYEVAVTYAVIHTALK